MKKIAVFLSFSAFVLLFSSCGGPEADAKKMIKQMEKYIEIAKKASADKKLDAKEIEELNNISKEMDELEKKYIDDKEGKEKIERYLEDHKQEFVEVTEEFHSTLMSLYECESADKVEELY